MIGGAGNDAIFGEAGDDTILYGTGNNGFEPGGLGCNNTSAGAGGAGGTGGSNGGTGGKGGVVDSPGCSNFLGVCSSGCDAQAGSTGATGGGPGGIGVVDRGW